MSLFKSEIPIKESILNEMVKQNTNWESILTKIFKYRRMQKAATTEDLEDVACSICLVDIDDLYSKKRNQEIVWARYLIWKYLHESGWSKTSIAIKYRKDHSTVLAGLNKADEFIDVQDIKYCDLNREFRERLLTLKAYENSTDQNT